MLVPKIITALKDYNREKFVGDLVAGVIVGVVALPLAIAFAIASGVILIGMGLAKLGTMIKLIPHPVITGFTSGIAVIIFSGEIKDF